MSIIEESFKHYKIKNRANIYELEDKKLQEAMQAELNRQKSSIELIASENFVSYEVLKAQGSVLTNKYAEGYSGKRYYGGCEFVDIVERLAIKRACQLFSCNWANVQPNSGSQANQGVYMALIKPGDKILGMSLASGGHLTHGAVPNQSGKWFHALQYGVKNDDGLIDYDEMEKLALFHKPKLIVAGASAYSRRIDFKRFREVADKVGAYFIADIAHYAGLIVTGNYPNPIKYAHAVTTTTHKTLRGPRGGMILSDDEEIEALRPEFKNYSEQIILNAKKLAETLESKGIKIISGGTDSHVILCDLRKLGITGLLAETSLDKAGITCNKNSIPFDPQKPFVTSGIRLGTPAVTTRGFKEKEIRKIGELIVRVLEGVSKNNEDNSVIEKTVKKEVETLCVDFPLYPQLNYNNQ